MASLKMVVFERLRRQEFCIISRQRRFRKER